MWAMLVERRGRRGRDILKPASRTRGAVVSSQHAFGSVSNNKVAIPPRAWIICQERASRSWDRRVQLQDAGCYLCIPYMLVNRRRRRCNEAEIKERPKPRFPKLPSSQAHQDRGGMTLKNGQNSFQTRPTGSKLITPSPSATNRTRSNLSSKPSSPSPPRRLPPRPGEEGTPNGQVVVKFKGGGSGNTPEIRQTGSTVAPIRSNDGGVSLTPHASWTRGQVEGQRGHLGSSWLLGIALPPALLTCVPLSRETAWL